MDCGCEYLLYLYSAPACQARIREGNGSCGWWMYNVKIRVGA